MKVAEALGTDTEALSLDLEKKKKLYLSYQIYTEKYGNISALRKEAKTCIRELFHEGYKMQGRDPIVYSYCLEENIFKLYRDPASYERVVKRLLCHLKVMEFGEEFALITKDM